MMQRHRPHPSGTFAACLCKAEPRHIVVYGTSLEEARRGVQAAAERHMLECTCGRRTAKHSSLARAVEEWGPVNGQMPLGLPTPVVSIRRRAARKEVAHG